LLPKSEGFGDSPSPDVATLTVAVCDVAPFNAIELGDTEHMDMAGPPPHVRLTLCAKPPPGARAKEYVAV